MAPKEKEMSKDDLLAHIAGRSSQAETSQQQISDERQLALDYYRQELFGNEEDGQSQVVTSEVRDTIEWMLPQLIEAFMGPDAPCEFKPQNAGDIEAAKQETKYVRYVFNEQNDGFLNIYTWFKDALLYKNGILKCYWDDYVDEKKEDYKNINVVEYAKLAQDNELVIEKVTMKVNGQKVDNLYPSIPPELVTIDIKAKRTRDCSQVKIYPVAPENFFVDADYTSVNLADVGFCREDSYLTETDLLNEGFTQELIDSLPDYNPSMNSETQNRFLNAGGVNWSNRDKSTRKIKISDVYVKIDFNGDGIAEQRFVKIAGDDVILENEECDYIPYRAITPIIMTHTFNGMSIADCVADLQLLKSTLWRQSLNSLYLSNNPRYTVVKGAVELDDLLISRAGGIIRQDMPGAVGTLETPFVGANTLPMIELIDRMREERTGVSSTTQGLNPDALGDSTNMMGAMIMNAAQARVKMIARIFAETGYKSVMLLIHQLVSQYEKNEKISDLGDGNYVPVNPSTWRTRRDMSVKVGLGYADKNQKIMSLERILNLQQQIFTGQQGEGPLLGADNIYNAVNDLLELTGMDTRDRYFSNPAQYQAPPPPPPTPQERAVDVAEADVEFQAQKAAAQHELDVAKHQDDVKLEWAKLIQNDRLERDKLKLEENRELGQLAMKAIELGHNKKEGTPNAMEETEDSGTEEIDSGLSESTPD